MFRNILETDNLHSLTFVSTARGSCETHPGWSKTQAVKNFEAIHFMGSGDPGTFQRFIRESPKQKKFFLIVRSTTRFPNQDTVNLHKNLTQE